jgi:phosphoglycerol transferase MdoB-like AlkP superfamily enzyme
LDTSSGLHADHQILLILSTYLAAACVVLATDWLALPPKARREFRPERSFGRFAVDIAMRLVVIAMIYILFFAISWRPLYSFLGTLSFFLIFTGISRAKFAFIREPLVFTDIALVVDVFKYKEIFYATRLNVAFWAGAIGYVFGVSALFYVFEPHLLPDRGRGLAILTVLAVLLVPGASLFVLPVRRVVSRIATRCVGRIHLRVNTRRFGSFGYVTFHFLMWLGKVKETFLDELAHKLEAVAHEFFGDTHGDRPPLVVVWQSESFLDMRHLGVDTLNLPNLDALKKRSARYGRLGNVFEGGYTLRTEFAVLSGLKPHTLGVDASYPYLRARNYADVVWPARFRKSGWRTHFIHPYERTFFMRHKAIPELGFDRMTMLEDFDHVPRPDAPYVSDSSLADRVADACEATDMERGAFIFVASMENHGPWAKGRAGALEDPVDIYCHILERSDAALGRLVEKLDALDRPVWLVFYGDHAPLLKSFADPFPDPRTDFVIAPLGSAKAKDVARKADAEPWDLLDILAEQAGFMTEMSLRTAPPQKQAVREPFLAHQPAE